MSDYCSDMPQRQVRVRVELGRRKLSLSDLDALVPGRIVELDCGCDDPVDVLANGHRIAGGEAVNVDGYLGVRIGNAVTRRLSLEQI